MSWMFIGTVATKQGEIHVKEQNEKVEQLFLGEMEKHDKIVGAKSDTV